MHPKVLTTFATEKPRFVELAAQLILLAVSQLVDRNGSDDDDSYHDVLGRIHDTQLSAAARDDTHDSCTR